MAAGDVVVFDAWLKDHMDGDHDYDLSTFKVGLTTGTTTPATTTAVPTWGAGGTTNFAAEEVTPGGNYSAGGSASTLTVGAAAGQSTHSYADVTWLSDASNPTNARWAILYDDTITNKNCICAVDLGVARDMSAGDLTIDFPANLFALTVA